MNFDLTYKEIFRAVYNWSRKNSSVKLVTLSGIGRSSFNAACISPRYQFKIYTDRLALVDNSDWINDLGNYLVCFYDVYLASQFEIESRIVVFNPEVVIEFLFEQLPPHVVNNKCEIHAHPTARLQSMLNNYN